MHIQIITGHRPCSLRLLDICFKPAINWGITGIISPHPITSTSKVIKINPMAGCFFILMHLKIGKKGTPFREFLLDWHQNQVYDL